LEEDDDDLAPGDPNDWQQDPDDHWKLNQPPVEVS
tara:strand:+ start:409 stop:513 length:105 start_codon:yes stop_codon:yes gene_type:complete